MIVSQPNSPQFVVKSWVYLNPWPFIDPNLQIRSKVMICSTGLIRYSNRFEFLSPNWPYLIEFTNDELAIGQKGWDKVTIYED